MLRSSSEPASEKEREGEREDGRVRKRQIGKTSRKEAEERKECLVCNMHVFQFVCAESGGSSQ